MKHKMIFFLLALGPFAGMGQDLSEVILKINNAYASPARLTMDTEYILQKGKDTFSIVQLESGNILKKGSSVYNRVGEVEIISTEEFTISVNNKEKTVTFLKAGTLTRSNPSKSMPDINKLLESADTAFMRISGTHQNSLVLSSAQSEYSQIEITYNTKNYFIEKMDLLYRPALNDLLNPQRMKLQILFKKIHSGKRINPSAFDQSTYVSLEGNKLVCSKNYKDYTLFARQ